MTGEEKLAYIQQQCDAMWEQKRELPVNCPYCGCTVIPGEYVCCALLDKAIRAIIARARAVEEGMRSYERREFGRMVMGDKYGPN